MLMKWSDLEPGDTIRFNDGVKRFWERADSTWTDEWCDRDFVVKEIEIKNNYITIIVREGAFSIRNNGTPMSGFGNYFGVLFDIVKLRDE